MALPSRTLNFPTDSDLHRRLKARIASRLSLARIAQFKRHKAWEDAEERTLAYLPESEKDADRRNDREVRGIPKYTTIQIPYSFALLMAAHTYWTSVFFARTPVHQYSGRHGEGEMQVQAMEALIDYQVQVGGAMAPYFIWLYDVGKYGCGVLGEYWTQDILHYGQIVEMEDPAEPQGAAPKLMQVTREVKGYVGSRLFNVSPWDFMHDPRVALKNFQTGEFCCRRIRLGWHDILRRKTLGFYNDNISKLKDHLLDRARMTGSTRLERPQFDMALMDDYHESSKHPAGSSFWEVYIELIPDEWGLGKGLMMPQKWCFTITEDEDIIVGASPLGLAHCQFPFAVAESEVEGYGLFTRGIPEIMAPIQQTMDWLVNTHFFNVRAAINNQFIVDPSKLVIKDVQNTGPGFVWRLRPEAYGTDLKSIFYQVPVQDVTRQHFADFQQMFSIGERTLGINDQIMGALAQGGRRTATEVRTSTGFGVNRLKTIAEYISAAAFGPHSQRLVQNSQQFYDAAQKFRRVGNLALDAGEQFLQVSPDDIVGFFDFVPVDGTLPVDRMAQANMWKEIFAGIRMMPPQVAMGYDWSRIFAWFAQLGGIKNINQFRVQVTPDQVLQAQAQAGNSIPLGNGASAPKRSPGVPPGADAATQAGINALTNGALNGIGG